MNAVITDLILTSRVINSGRIHARQSHGHVSCCILGCSGMSMNTYSVRACLCAVRVRLDSRASSLAILDVRTERVFKCNCVYGRGAI